MREKTLVKEMLDKEWRERKTDDEKQETSPLADHRQREEKTASMLVTQKKYPIQQKVHCKPYYNEETDTYKKVTELHTF